MLNLPTTSPGRFEEVKTVQKDHGYEQQVFRNDEYGITVERTRPAYDDRFKMVWMIDSMPKRKFSTYIELKAAVDKTQQIKPTESRPATSAP